MANQTCTICHRNPGIAQMLIEQYDGQKQQEYACGECIARMTGAASDTGSGLLSGLQNLIEQSFAQAAGGNGQTAVKAPPKGRSSKTPTLDQYGRDLTAAAREGKLDLVIGRADEIKQSLEVLTRRTKNNVALIGEPGVGKTAIVEGIAQQIASGEIEAFTNHRLISLDLAGMIAGAQYRGQFEQRFKSALEELLASDGNIILFIDELHTIVGAGSAEGSMDAANMLKPHLARGEFQLMGATTLDEYRNAIEEDGALARRFTSVFIDEPSLDDTIAILQGTKKAYEAHHGLSITDDAIAAAVKLADRYIHDGNMPDKAIDLIDQAAARQRGDATMPADTDAEIEALTKRKAEAIAREAFEVAADCKRQIEALQNGTVGGNLTVANIASVIASRTGIPATDLQADEKVKLKNLDSDLHRRVIGQDTAVSAVADAVKVARAGFKKKSGPVGTFLFLGPTGVGKTELAKALAEQMFGTEDALVRIDMSEYREAHTVSRLIGSPPGYVGYGQGGQLTEPVRTRPYRVLLLDEIEKAHPDVWNIFLQVFDDGRLTDGRGRTVVFNDCIIIMTSNLGAQQAKRGALGFAAEERDVQRDAAKDAFSPELWNRIDETITFDALTEDNIRDIAVRLVGELAETVKSEHEAVFTVSEEAIDRLAKEGFSDELGARPLARHIYQTLTKSLTDAVLNDRVTPGATITVDGDLKFTVTDKTSV